MAPIGQRVQFTGEGATLLGTYLIYALGPAILGYAVSFGFSLVGGLVGAATTTTSHGRHAAPAGPSGFAIVMILLGVLIHLTLVFGGSLMFTQKFIGFRTEGFVLDGQRCKYNGTFGQFVGVGLLNGLLCIVTVGIYTPWAICRIVEFIYENSTVNGQPARMTFSGSPTQLFGKYILGIILTYCTLGIYGAWFANDLFAFFWENTKLDGRPFNFRRDPAGFLGTYILTVIISMCTLGIYYPWGICNIMKWEAERVT
jgi:hypothetical protein